MENLANAGRESLTMSKVVNLNVDKVIQENPGLMMQEEYRHSQQSGLDSTTREFEELLKYDNYKKEKIIHPKLPTPKTKNKIGSQQHKKDSSDAFSKGKSRNSDIDSEEVIRNLDQMMNDYLKRKT